MQILKIYFFCGAALAAAGAALAGAATAFGGGTALTGAGLVTLGTFGAPAGFGLRTLCFLENFKFLKNFGSTFFLSKNRIPIKILLL
jgi:hypothetical protein